MEPSSIFSEILLSPNFLDVLKITNEALEGACWWAIENGEHILDIEDKNLCGEIPEDIQEAVEKTRQQSLEQYGTAAGRRRSLFSRKFPTPGFSGTAAQIYPDILRLPDPV